MIRIQSQADIEFRERFYRCELVENPDPREVKLWQKLIGNNETVKESDIIDRIQNLLNIGSNPENDTRCLNVIFSARNFGYITDIGIPWKHVYRINSIFRDSIV
jgi:hypothetical protein